MSSDRNNRGGTETKMYPDVPFLGRKVRHRWRGAVYHEDTRAQPNAHLLLRKPPHEVGAHSLVVGLKVTSEPSQTFPKQIHNPEASG